MSSHDEPYVQHLETRAGGVQTVARALAMLEAFDEHAPELSVAELGARAQLNRATAYRFCRTLLALGWLEEVEAGCFRPGPAALAVAQGALAARRLPTLARPALQRLRTQTGAIVNLAQLDGTEVVYLCRLLNDELPALRLFVGSRLPAATTSLGRAILADLPRDELRARLAQLPPDDADALAAELERTRARGWALNDEELVVGAIGVGAAIRTRHGPPRAAVNVSLFRRPDPAELKERIAPLVIAAAQAVAEAAERDREQDAA